MFRRRVITAAVAGVLAIWGVLALPVEWFGVALLAIVLLAAWEWSQLLNLAWPFERIGYCLLTLGLLIVAWGGLENRLFVWLLLVLACAFWCGVLFWLWRYAANPELRNSPLSWQLAGLFTLVVPWVLLMDLRGAPGFGAQYVLFLLLLVWIADSGAYFVGRRWGRRKLAPGISPGKTREGAFGALAATLLFSLLGGAVLGMARWPWFILVCMVTVVFSIVGDLFESMLKRQHSAKDSGYLLPGHGGVPGSNR
jgi:phosphatidate cytidylyltransferase